MYCLSALPFFPQFLPDGKNWIGSLSITSKVTMILNNFVVNLAKRILNKMSYHADNYMSQQLLFYFILLVISYNNIPSTGEAIRNLSSSVWISSARIWLIPGWFIPFQHFNCCFNLIIPTLWYKWHSACVSICLTLLTTSTCNIWAIWATYNKYLWEKIKFLTDKKIFLGICNPNLISPVIHKSNLLTQDFYLLCLLVKDVNHTTCFTSTFTLLPFGHRLQCW